MIILPVMTMRNKDRATLTKILLTLLSLNTILLIQNFNTDFLKLYAINCVQLE